MSDNTKELLGGAALLAIVLWSALFGPPSLQGRACGPSQHWVVVTGNAAGNDLSCE